MACLSAVDCQSPGRNRKQNEIRSTKSQGRKQVVVETQRPQWITTFPTVIETICSLHTQLLTNSGFYSWKISNQSVSPTWLTLHCFSTRSPLLLPHRGSHNPLWQWLAEINHLNSQLQALGPQSSPSHILMKVCKVLTNSSCHSPVQAAVTTENQVGQRDSKLYSHSSSSAAVNLVSTVFLDWLFQVWSGNEIRYSAFLPLGYGEGSHCHQLVSLWEVHYGDRVWSVLLFQSLFGGCKRRDC